MSDSIGNRIESVRKSQGLSQAISGQKIGVSQGGLVSDLEKGRRYPPKTLRIAICYMFAINPVWLLTGEGSMEAKDEQKTKLDARAEAQKRLDEAFAQYHKCLDLILTKGASEQRKAAIGMLVVGADEIRQRGEDNSIQTSPILGGGKDETFAEYHKCLDLILANGATELRRDTIGMLVVESDEIRQRERDTSSNETTDN